MKITLIRHGEVEEPFQGKYNGHNDIGLSEQGKKEAQILAKHFKAACFDGVFCSDLRRCKETLKPFVQHQDAIYSDKLREKSWGRHEGLSFEEIVQRDGIVYENFFQWINALDGEDVVSYTQRVEEFFKEFIFSQNYMNVLVLTHSGVIRTLMAQQQNISLQEAFSIALPYGSYVVFDTDLQTFSKVKYKVGYNAILT